MLHIFLDKEPWFSHKQYGFGSGLPISWKGWVLCLSYLSAVIGMAFFFDEEGFVWEIGFVIATLLFLFIIWKKTDDGWQWRWGNRKNEAYVSRGKRARASKHR